MAAYLGYKKYPYYLPTEVVVHNKPDDIWVSLNRRVLNITPMIQKLLNEGSQECELLLAFAGKDISQWFNSEGELKDRVDPITGTRTPVLPHGAFPHIPYKCPTTIWEPVPDPPWWKDDQYHIGWVSLKPRNLRIINMLTATTKYITVCEEDTIYRIMERYLYANAHAGSYTWRSVRGELDMSKTLEENRVPAEDFGEPPSPLFLYFNRDMTRDRYKAPNELAAEAEMEGEELLEEDEVEEESEVEKEPKPFPEIYSPAATTEDEQSISEKIEEELEPVSKPETDTEMAESIVDEVLARTMKQLMMHKVDALEVQEDVQEAEESEEEFLDVVPYPEGYLSEDEEADEVEIVEDVVEDYDDYYEVIDEEEYTQLGVEEDGGGDAGEWLNRSG